MDATNFFVYTASIASIVLLILVAVAFYFLYRTLTRVQSFFETAETMLNEIQLVKFSTAVSGYKVARSLLHLFRRGGE